MITGINRYQALNSLAEFWSTRTRENDFKNIVSMVGLDLHNTINNDLLNVIKNMAGDEDQYISHTVIDINPEEVFATNGNPGDQSFKIYPNDDIAVLEDPEIYYLIPHNTNTIPYSILSKNEILILGISFFYDSNYLWFYKNPLELFEGNKIFVIESKVFNKSNYDFIYGVNNIYTNLDYVAHYQRFEQNAKALKLALAAICNIPIIRETSALLDKKVYDDHTTYIFENQTIEIWYKHNELNVGQIYEKDTLIDDPVIVLNKSGIENDKWYREISWDAGLSMDFYTPFLDLVLEDKFVPAFVRSINTEYNKPHIEIDIKTNESVDAGNTKYNNNGSYQKYWDYINGVEAATGFFLNDIVGLPNTLNASTFVNPIDVYFEAILKQKGLIIIFDEDKIPDYSDGIDFAKQEFPFGHIPVIFVKESPALINEDETYIIDHTQNLISHE